MTNMDRSAKDVFMKYFRNNIKREGSEELLSWLLQSDFFTAPASTRFHLAEPEGLCMHSIHVYERLRGMYSEEKKLPLTPAEEEKLAVVGLLHDVCKVDFYIEDFRNQKTYDSDKVRMASKWEVKHDAKGDFIWETVPYYRIEDSFPYGHGEKSVVMLEKYMWLSDEERMSIRWHMGFSDDTFKGGSATVGNAFNLYPLAALLNCADILAAYLDESGSSLF